MAVHFAASLIETKELIGSFALKNIDTTHSHAELELWIGAPWLKQGFATEATREVLAFGFNQLNLQRIYAYHMPEDPASTKLLEKLGLQREGILRKSICKWGDYQDMWLSALLAAEHKKMGL
jgi:RimJ/RimL family protein N-acetyltransferase